MARFNGALINCSSFICIALTACQPPSYSTLSLTLLRCSSDRHVDPFACQSVPHSLSCALPLSLALSLAIALVPQPTPHLKLPLSLESFYDLCAFHLPFRFSCARSLSLSLPKIHMYVYVCFAFPITLRAAAFHSNSTTFHAGRFHRAKQFWLHFTPPLNTRHSRQHATARALTRSKNQNQNRNQNNNNNSQ